LRFVRALRRPSTAHTDDSAHRRVMAPTREELEKEEDALCEVLQAAEDLMQCAPHVLG
jgi:hypothetical protein